MIDNVGVDFKTIKKNIELRKLKQQISELLDAKSYNTAENFININPTYEQYIKNHTHILISSFKNVLSKSIFPFKKNIFLSNLLILSTISK